MFLYYMTIKQKNKFKAAFMLMVFALNTVVAFACSVGLNMGFNTHHHQQKSGELVTLNTQKHDHKTTFHKHNMGAVKDHDEANTPAKDDCCNKNAIQLQQVDKFLSQSSKIEIGTPVILLADHSSYQIGHILFAHFINDQYYFVRSDHPPIKDIRIAIQSFQI